jgi:hypothetical protein
MLQRVQVGHSDYVASLATISSGARKIKSETVLLAPGAEDNSKVLV